MPRRALHTASHGAGSWRGRTGSSRDRRGGSPIQFRFGALRLRPSAPGARGSGARSCRRACALRRKASARALAACAFYAAWSTQFWRTNSATARRTSSLRRTRKRRESWDTLRSSCAVILTSSFLSRTGNFTAMPMLYHKPHAYCQALCPTFRMATFVFSSLARKFNGCYALGANVRQTAGEPYDS